MSHIIDRIIAFDGGGGVPYAYVLCEYRQKSLYC